MSNKWETRKLQDCFYVANDKSNNIKSTDYQDSGCLPIIDQSSNFIAGYTNDLNKSYKQSIPVIIFGDHTRHVKYIDFPFALGADGTQVLKANQEMSNKYLYYVIEYASELIGNYGYDRHMKHLKDFKCDITLNKNEQQKIAEILSAIDKKIELTQKLIGKYEKVKLGLMENIFEKSTSDWQRLKLGEIVNFNKGKVVPISSMKKKEDIPFLDIAGIEGKILYYTNPHNGVKAEKFDILMVWDGERAGLVSFNCEGIIGSTINRLRVYNEKVSPNYLFYYLQYQNKWIRNQRTGTGVPHVSKDLHRILEIKFPDSINKQIDIFNVLSTIDKKIISEKDSLSKFKNIKQSLMQDLLTGKVRVNIEDEI